MLLIVTDWLLAQVPDSLINDTEVQGEGHGAPTLELSGQKPGEQPGHV